MKLTKEQLRRIIKEEIGNVVSESPQLGELFEKINAIFKDYTDKKITKEEAYSMIIALGKEHTDPEPQKWIKQASDQLRPSKPATEPELDINQ